MSFFKGKQGKDIIIIGIIAFIGYKFMSFTSGGLIQKPIQKQTI
ncbi:MAG: hypothetical protein Q8906_06060 [Bacillota bacterium]|nr:hypothetical protein [Bacillota bacterium]